MIRLVAADMDGTLLNSRGEIPAGFGDAVRALSGNGVRFAVASGRQYEGVVNYFDGLRDEIIFLCENGARVVWRGEDIFLSEVPFPKLSEPAELIRSIPNAYPLICVTGAAWIESDDAVLLENASIYYKRLEIVPDVLEAAKHDRICKIAAFDADGAESNSYPPLRRFEDRFRVTLSARCWVDLMNPGVDKGLAMRTLQEYFGCSPEETMAFGDYLNDVPMMEYSFYSYAMANAHPDLKLLCRYETLSNDENGVMTAMRERFPFL